MLDEAGAGDPAAARDRLALLVHLPLLDIQRPDVSEMAENLIAKHLLPEKAAADARHVAVAAVFGVDYLLTWNCRHIANAATLPGIYRLIRTLDLNRHLSLHPRSFPVMSSTFVDPVVSEIHMVRVAMLDEAGGDIDLMMRQVAERQSRSGHPIITQPFQRRTEQSHPREAAATPLMNSESHAPPA